MDIKLTAFAEKDTLEWEEDTMNNIQQQLQENTNLYKIGSFLHSDDVDFNDMQDYVKSSQLSLLQSVVEWCQTTDVSAIDIIEELTKIIEENK